MIHEFDSRLGLARWKLPYWFPPHKVVQFIIKDTPYHRSADRPM